MHTTGSTAVIPHTCDGCAGRVVRACTEYLEHHWHCLEHYGHPTGEQLCSCGALRHHPDDGHMADHRAGHRAYLADGGECWCTTWRATDAGGAAETGGEA